MANLKGVKLRSRFTDWTRHAKAAPFRRNDDLLKALPIGLVLFPGSGVTDNLADKAKRLGIPLMDHRR